MTKHAVVIAGGGLTGLMLAAELALARVDVAIFERRENQDLVGVPAPSAVLIRPDGYVAWAGAGMDEGLREALTLWFGAAA